MRAGHRRLIMIAIATIALLVPGIRPAHAATGPGSIVSSQQAEISSTLTDAKTVATKIVYRTTGDDGLVTASAVVYRPEGTAPAGGWPLIGFAHGTSGVTSQCAPSDSPDALGSDKLFATFIKQGWAVVAPDYRGLGDSNTTHRYLMGKDIAHDVLDSVRAAKTLLKTPKAKVALVGISQGGHGTQFAAEVAASYAPDLNIVGVADDSAPLDLTPIVKSIDNHTVTLQQYVVYPYVVSGILSVHPELSWKDYLSPLAIDVMGGKMPCANSKTAILTTFLRSNPTSIRFSGSAARSAMLSYLQATELPRRHVDMPIYVSRAKNDTLVPTAWQTPRVARMCTLHDQMYEHLRPGDHTIGGTQEDDDLRLAWIKDRFAGLAAPTTCWDRTPR